LGVLWMSVGTLDVGYVGKVGGLSFGPGGGVGCFVEPEPGFSVCPPDPPEQRGSRPESPP
jgi:hypothetical protein